MFFRSVYVWCVVVVIVVSSCVVTVIVQQQREETTQCKRCNIVLVSLQSVARDHMSVYGYEKNTTPRLLEFAQHAQVFSNYITAGYITPVSEMSVHTGRYPFSNGVINFTSYLRDDTTTLAEVLKSVGYRTGAYGSSPEYKDSVALEQSFSRGFDVFHVADRGVGESPQRHSVPLDSAEAWVLQDKTKPFFLWIPLGTAHWPYGDEKKDTFTSREYRGFLKQNILNNKVMSRVWDGWFYPIVGSSVANWNVYKREEYSHRRSLDVQEEQKFRTTLPQTMTKLSEDDWGYLMGKYDDGVLLTDTYIGEVLSFIAAQHLEEDTIVVVQGDHGEELGEHGFIGHYDTSYLMTRAPLLIRIPGHGNGTVPGLVSSVDLFATLLDVVGVPHSSREGSSVVPLITRATSTIHTEVYSTRTPLFEVFFSTDSDSRFDALRAVDSTKHFHDTVVQTSEWRLVHRMTESALKQYSWWTFLTGVEFSIPEFALYNIATDPLEKRDVYTENPEVAKMLRDKLLKWEVQQDATLGSIRTYTGERQDYF